MGARKTFSSPEDLRRLNLATSYAMIDIEDIVYDDANGRVTLAFFIEESAKPGRFVGHFFR